MSYIEKLAKKQRAISQERRADSVLSRTILYTVIVRNEVTKQSKDEILRCAQNDKCCKAIYETGHYPRVLK